MKISTYRKELAKLEAANERLAPMVEELTDLRRQLRLQNWNAPEVAERANNLVARIEAELEAIEPVEKALKNFHRRYWQARIDALLGDGITLERIVQAWKIRWSVFGDRTPLENFAWRHFQRMLAGAMPAEPDTSEVPLEPPNAEALDDARDIRAGTFFGWWAR